MLYRTRQLLIFLLIASCFALTARHFPARLGKDHLIAKDGDTIRWSAKYRLTFEDFKATSRPANGLPMDTLATCAYSFDFRIIGVNNKARIVAAAVFSREQSWMREKTSRVLQHEQGHFDIAEIYALRFENMVNAADSLDPRSFIFFIDESLKQIAVECNIEQQKYDTWTMNTLGKDHYFKWIKEQLDSLGAFKEGRPSF